MIDITETPKVKYYESNSNPNASGDGAEIPVIIGITGNETPATGIKEFKNYKECAKSIANGGIGTDPSTNPLLAFLKDFFEENIKLNNTDLCVPYVYVIDLGKIGVSEAEDVKNWTDAMKLAKTKRKATCEVYVGFKKADTADKIIPLIESAVDIVVDDAIKGNPRIIYFSVDGVNDTEIKAYTDKTKTKFIRNTRVALIEPAYYGKTCANIFTTPYYEEPGYTDYRSVKEGTFTERTDNDEDALQNAGIIFNRDELPGQEVHPKICLGVSTAFANEVDERPTDCLLHSRRNVDQLIRDAFTILYPQIKRNETEVNLSYLQSDLDTLVNDKIRSGYMLNGTVIDIVEEESTPYHLKVQGSALPVNQTDIIDFYMYVDAQN